MSTIISSTASAVPVYPAAGDLTFGQMANDVAIYYGMQKSGEMLALAGRAINEIIDDLNRKQVWMFNLVTSPTIPTVANVDTVALPSDFWKTYNSRKTDSIDFTLTSLRQIDFDTRYQSQSNITGYPYVFVIKNTFRDGTVKLFPTPDSIYSIQIRYFKLIAKMAQPTDLIDMPRPYQNLVLYGARSHFGMLNEKSDAASFWQGKFAEAYEEMKRADEDDGDENLRFTNIEEGMNWSYVNPNSRPRAFDLW